MNTWILSLWNDLEHGEWGTTSVIGACWDLSHLADCGLVASGDLDRRLDAIVQRELLRVETAKVPRRKREWLFTEPYIAEWDQDQEAA